MATEAPPAVHPGNGAAGSAVKRSAKRSRAQSTPIAATTSLPRLCVFIDGESFSPANVHSVLAEAGKRGVVITTKLFASTEVISKWESAPAPFIIEPCTIWGTRSLDHALIEAIAVETMHTRYRGNYDGLCLVTSDLDLARTVRELREARLLVYGFGYAHTPPSMRSAYDDFVEIAKAEGSTPLSHPHHPQPTAPLQFEQSTQQASQRTASQQTASQRTASQQAVSQAGTAAQQLEQVVEQAQLPSRRGGQDHGAHEIAQPQIEDIVRPVDSSTQPADGLQQAQDSLQQTADGANHMSDAEMLEAAKAVIAECAAGGVAALSAVGVRLRGRSNKKTVLWCLRAMQFQLEQRKGDHFIVGHLDGSDMSTWRRPVTPQTLTL